MGASFFQFQSTQLPMHVFPHQSLLRQCLSSPSLNRSLHLDQSFEWGFGNRSCVRSAWQPSIYGPPPHASVPPSNAQAAGTGHSPSKQSFHSIWPFQTCTPLVPAVPQPDHTAGQGQYIFTITYKSENQRNYDLRTETEADCNAWIDAIRRASYSKVVEQKEELEQKHLHIIQILESERQAKWHYVQQTEELVAEVKKLKAELQKFKKDRTSNHIVDEETDEIKKIKKEVNDEQQVVLKVQSFFRGWLCRRRWKQIVELYIRSPHAESMRKRNSIVFSMVECEEEYNQQLSTLVTCFLRPLRMAASSKKPPISHEDVNSIFLNSETLLFLHQIFFKGLCARLENWPTLVLGDLFDMLLPMLCIYQEYVRNHHYSLQVLAEYKQRPEFNNLLKRYEEKPACETRTLEIFLTYPMHQIPRYIITLHELLAHTPHDHVERSSLEYAKTKLEELSKIMHDEVSETENIRKNLSIERMIIEGCDILLDVNQTFVRQGPLLQVFTDRSKASRGRLPSIGNYPFRDTKKEEVRQVFLFTNHMLLTTRAKENGRLHLAKQHGKVPLIDCTLIEDPYSDILNFEDESTSLESLTSGISSSSQATLLPFQTTLERDRLDYNGLDFRIIVDNKNGPQIIIILVASTHIEKAAWCSDISQCIENLHYSDLLNSSMSESSSVTMPQSVRSDPKLFRDDVDIKFSRTLNSCKVPQIRHGSVDRLLDRLTDLRFLSIDFLNTFLLTYRVFTTGPRVLEALKKVYRSPDGASGESDADILSEQSVSETDLCSGSQPHEFTKEPPNVDSKNIIRPMVEKLDQLRQIRTIYKRADVSSSEEEKDTAADLERQRSSSISFGKHVDFIRSSLDRGESMDSDDSRNELASFLAPTKQAPIATCETLCDPDYPDIPAIKMDSSLSDVVLLSEDFGETVVDDLDCNGKLLPPGSVPGGSASPESMLCGSPTLPALLRSEASSDTLTPSTPHTSPMTSPLGSPRRSLPQPLSPKSGETSPRRPSTPVKMPEKYSPECFSLSPLSSPVRAVKPTKPSSPVKIPSPILQSTSPHRTNRSPSASPKLRRAPSPISYSYSSPNIVAPQIKLRPYSTEAESVSSTPRSSFATHVEGSPPQAKAGTVVTSSRASKRRSSSSAATAAFAVATAGSAYAGDQSLTRVQRFLSAGAGATDTRLLKKRESVISTAATMRVLNIIKHWVSKHSQDFDCDPQLKASVIDFLEEMVCNTNLLPAEHKTAASILRTISKEATDSSKPDLTKLLQPPEQPSKDTFDTLSALDIAEQLTFLDHQIFTSIRSEELLGQAWMKPEKAAKAPHVLLVSKRFNEVSRLVVSEVVGRQNLSDRVACIEKWAAIADICRCMHNYNGVLQICAAFVNSSVYRLKKTWEKLSKQTKQMIERLQTLVSSDGRFKNMRDALHRCDPPCIPYLGMYLTDLSFIEEGTPDLTEDGLVNFSKMRMIAHVIREIRLFQQTSYRIEHHPRVTNYLLDSSRLLDDEQTYKASLEIEPKLSRLSVVSTGSS